VLAFEFAFEFATPKTTKRQNYNSNIWSCTAGGDKSHELGRSGAAVLSGAEFVFHVALDWGVVI
jgi:hypothetical protein